MREAGVVMETVQRKIIDLAYKEKRTQNIGSAKDTRKIEEGRHPAFNRET
jgi:hypothetical protein